METFVVRVFVPAARGETPFAGVVEHVGTSWSARFGSDEELLTAIRSRLERERAPMSTFSHEVRTN
jgi:hypothetical protein